MATWDSASLAAALAQLGYPGFAYMRGKSPCVRPEDVLLGGMAAEDLESRVMEGMPWVVVNHPEMDWEWLIREAATRSVQNRLGFVITLARQVCERRGEEGAVARLRSVEARLDEMRIEREDTLSHSRITQAERRWLRVNRPPEAEHWFLLTDFSADGLRYV